MKKFKELTSSVDHTASTRNHQNICYQTNQNLRLLHGSNEHMTVMVAYMATPSRKRPHTLPLIWEGPTFLSFNGSTDLRLETILFTELQVYQMRAGVLIQRLQKTEKVATSCDL
jgi:hypothetical protein